MKGSLIFGAALLVVTTSAEFAFGAYNDLGLSYRGDGMIL